MMGVACSALVLAQNEHSSESDLTLPAAFTDINVGKS